MLQPSSAANSPFTIGVSGHRDIHPDHIDDFRTEIVKIIDYLGTLVPNTQIRVMVGMAEGADLLVAQTALERHLSVDAALPMPLEQYSADFGVDSLALLKDLLARPQVQCIDLSPPVKGGSDDDSEHHSLYVNLTDSLIRKSNLLIALWDGESSALPGGTADTVLKYLGARTTADTAPDISFVEEAGDTTLGYQFVYWIPARRKKNTATASRDLPQPCYLSAIDEKHLRIHREMPPEIMHQLLELDGYNRQFDELQTSGVIASRDTLMGAVPDSVPAGERAVLQRIDAEYSKADALAVFYQRYSDRLFKWFSLMAAAMGLVFLTYTELLTSELLMVAYLVILLLGLVIFRSVRGRHWFSRHLVYRVLAETMRTKFFLRMAAADSQVNAAELIRLTGIDRFTGFSWITNILKNVEPFSESERKQQAPGSALQATQQAWIENQERYYTAKVTRLGHTHHRLERMKGGLFLVLAIIAATLVTWGHDLHEILFLGHIPMAAVLVFLMALLPVWFGIWEIFQNKMAIRELLWQYRNQLGHFSRARSQLARVATPERQMAVLADLGRRSLFESYLWTIHRFHREHEPPAVG